MTKNDKVDTERAGLKRREVLTGALAAGTISTPLASSADVVPDEGITWDYETDVLVLGAGCVGLTAAVRARDLGNDVLVLEQNYDVGGKLAHSGGWTSLGGGDPIQERDRLGTDPDNIGLTAPLVSNSDLTDDPDTLFRDMTDWSVVNDAGVPEYRFNDPEQHRAWADNAPKVRQFLMDNHVRFSRISSTHFGGGMTKARAPWAIMKLADKTDVEAGTITREDNGSAFGERNSAFSPMFPPSDGAGALGAPGCVFGGFIISRSLEYSARRKGVRFMLNRHMDHIYREASDEGRVIGVSASHTPRFDPDTGEQLMPFWPDGVIEEKARTITVRARKAIVIGTGGYMGNIPFRSMFDPRMRETSIQVGTALLGESSEDASGILAGMKAGGALAGLMQPYGHSIATPRLSNRVGTSAASDQTFPGHPTFSFCRSVGLSIGPAGWEHVIAVNQVGRRFCDETSIGSETDGHAMYPPGNAGTNVPFTPLDWRNTSVDHIRSTYALGYAHDAALALNEGSEAPDYRTGPVWSIFDQAAVERNGWDIRYPYVANPPDGYFFVADTIEQLSRLVESNQHQTGSLKYLAETIAQYNAAAETGEDTKFEKRVMYKIGQAPFYAALVPMVVYDSFGGLKINGKSQVVDMAGTVIPGLYAGGEASGGGRQHGIGRAAVHGYIAGTNADTENV